jgi:hypothetical protein
MLTAGTRENGIAMCEKCVELDGKIERSYSAVSSWLAADAKVRKLTRAISDVEGDFAETMFGRGDSPLLLRRLKFSE